MTDAEKGVVSYEYDAASQPETMMDVSGATSYGYDDAGRVTSVASPQGTVGYGYDAAGRRTRIDYPDNRSVTYTFDGDGRMATVTDWAGKQVSYGYDDAGREQSQTNPNGTSASYSYDTAGRLTTITHVGPGNTTIASFSNEPDAAGNPLSATEQMSMLPGGTATYSYDRVNRLKSATYPDAAWSRYQCDPMGNRTELDDQGGTTTYSYDKSDRLLSTTGEQALSFSWDGRGNETAKGSQSFSYDAANRLTTADTGANTATYVYNGEGVRIGKTVNGTTTTYLQDLVGGLPRVLVETTGGQETLYVYGLGLAFQVNADGSHRYYHSDSLGSTRVVTDDSGNPVCAYNYDAYGAVRQSVGEGRAFTYTGEQLDVETSMVFLRARYYDPQTGRFGQRDPLPGVVTHSASLHRYIYAEDDPTSKTDPSGQCIEDGCIAEIAILTYLVANSPEIAQQVQEWTPMAEAELPKIASMVGPYLPRLTDLASRVSSAVQNASRLCSQGRQISQELATKTEASNPALFEAYKAELRREMMKPIVQDSKPQALIDELYRPGAQVGSGSTAAAIRHELSTGELVGGRSRLQKGSDYLVALQRWLQSNPLAGGGDRAAAENVALDLADALPK